MRVLVWLCMNSMLRICGRPTGTLVSLCLRESPVIVLTTDVSLSHTVLHSKQLHYAFSSNVCGIYECALNFPQLATQRDTQQALRGMLQTKIHAVSISLGSSRGRLEWLQSKATLIESISLVQRVRRQPSHTCVALSKDVGVTLSREYWLIAGVYHALENCRTAVQPGPMLCSETSH